jgi:hypothetical protein
VSSGGQFVKRRRPLTAAKKRASTSVGLDVPTARATPVACSRRPQLLIGSRPLCLLVAASVLFAGSPTFSGMGGKRFGLWQGLRGRVGISACAVASVPALAFWAVAWSGERQSSGNVVVFDPGSSNGKPFPLLAVLDDASREDLSRGRRTVILFDHDCEVCGKYLVARSAASNAREFRVINVEGKVPPGARGPWSLFKIASLRPGARCVVDVPVEVVLIEGVVRDVRLNRSPDGLAQ